MPFLRAIIITRCAAAIHRLIREDVTQRIEEQETAATVILGKISKVKGGVEEGVGHQLFGFLCPFLVLLRQNCTPLAGRFFIENPLNSRYKNATNC